MTLFLVRDPHNGDAEVWVAAERDDELYVYDPHTRLFHRSDALFRDFYGDQELNYEAIDRGTASAKVNAGVGAYDARAVPELVAAHRSDPSPLRPEQVLGAASPKRPSALKREAAMAGAVANARPGVWVTWRTYDAGRRSAAYVAASALRRGKVRALDVAGPVTSRVIATGEGFAVEVARRGRACKRAGKSAVKPSAQVQSAARRAGDRS